MRENLSNLVADTKLYSLHSFRPGGATAAAQARGAEGTRLQCITDQFPMVGGSRAALTGIERRAKRQGSG